MRPLAARALSSAPPAPVQLASGLTHGSASLVAGNCHVHSTSILSCCLCSVYPAVYSNYIRVVLVAESLAVVLKAECCMRPELADTVVLDVRGMKCGGCSAAVRRILLADPAVEAAAVNLLTESAVVRLRREAYAADPGADRGRRAAELLTAKARLLLRSKAVAFSA